MSEPRTTGGQMLLMAGLTFGSGRRLADYPELIVTIEVQAATDERERLRQRVIAWGMFGPVIEQVLALLVPKDTDHE